MNPDKVTEHITNKSVDFLLKGTQQLIQAAMLFILASAATATDPFFRKNMGERYFSRFRVGLSLCGWWAVMGVAGAYSMQVHHHKFPYLLAAGGLIISLAYIVFSILNLIAIRRRQVTGVIWHSKFKGESIFGYESTGRDLLIECAVILVLCFVSLFLAGFFALSRIMGYMANSLTHKALYNRYLDIQDAQIEAEFMETALRDGFPPRQTGGMYQPLPSRYTGQHRATVARALATGAFDANPIPTSTPTRRQQFTAGPQGGKTAPAEEVEEPDPAVPVARFHFPKLNSKLVMGLFIVLAVLAALATFEHFSPIPIEQLFSMSRPPAAKPPVPAKVIANPQPPSVEQFGTRRHIKPTVVSLGATTQSLAQPPDDVKPTAAPVPETKPDPAPTVASPPAISERDSLLDPFRSKLAEETARFAKFNGDCETRMSHQTNQVAGVPQAYRQDLEQRSDKYQQTVRQWLQRQEDMLGRIKTDVDKVANNPQSDPQGINDSMQSYLNLDAAQRKTILFILGDMDGKIAFAYTNRPAQ